MKTILLISIEEVRVPDEGFVNGGWYQGRQYKDGCIGSKGELLDRQGTRPIFKKATKTSLLKRIAKSGGIMLEEIREV